jgi:hypothetical protein
LAGINRDITERKEWESRLEKMHAQLLDVSRQAGMAEVATSVLHNVGNVLNSVNTSATIIADRLKNSKSGGIAKLLELFQQHNGDLAGFLAQPGRADQVLEYLASLADHLRTEESGLCREVEELTGNIEHIKEIVVMQQSYAKISGITETVSATALVEDAIRMNNAAMIRHGIELTKFFESTPPITVEKHKVLQILVNVIRNAKYACDDSGRDDKHIAIRVRNTADRVKIEVSDNGVGIPKENLTRIFNHGFTTRSTGHGFGLHSGSLAAQELGGPIDGPQRRTRTGRNLYPGNSPATRARRVMSHNPIDPNRRILVIDDNPSIHADFRKILCAPEAPSSDGLTAAESALFGGESTVATRAGSVRTHLGISGHGRRGNAEGGPRGREPVRHGLRRCAHASGHRRHRDRRQTVEDRSGLGNRHLHRLHGLLVGGYDDSAGRLGPDGPAQEAVRGD